jgi:hypothetical protein
MVCRAKNENEATTLMMMTTKAAAAVRTRTKQEQEQQQPLHRFLVTTTILGLYLLHLSPASIQRIQNCAGHASMETSTTTILRKHLAEITF